MTKISKTLLAVVLALGAIAVLASRPAPASSGASRLRLPSSTPPRVLQILDRSCADCHSDQTRWPWYSSVPPVSWIVAKHVRDGRRFLNLSRFDSRTLRDQQDLLHAMAREVKARRMPLGSYTFIHRDARLAGIDAGDLIRWAEQERGRLATIAASD
jgi:hypothetical protein